MIQEKWMYFGEYHSCSIADQKYWNFSQSTRLRERKQIISAGWIDESTKEHSYAAMGDGVNR